MMQTQDAEAIVASLRRISPPEAVIHVGVGKGTGAMHQWRQWNPPAAWLVDAEPAQLGWTERLTATQPGWQVCSATLAETDGQAPFYGASNPAETGLLAPGKLTSLWPNLREGERTERATTRLDTLLAGSGRLPEGTGCWLIVDCLPALRVLQGAPGTLERCSVLWLRALLQPMPDIEAGATLDALQAFLAPLGFCCVQVSEGNHPAVGEALFVRDWAQHLQPVITELRASNTHTMRQNQELGKRLAEQEAAAQAATQERDAQARAAAELQARLDALANEKAGLSSRLDAQAKVHAELADKLAALEQAQAASAEALQTAQAALSTRSGERDAQARLASERQARIDAVTREKDELAGKLTAASGRHTELSDQLASLEQQHASGIAALEAAQANLAAQATLAAERQGKIDALAKEKAELTTKHASLEKELAAKGEALKNAQADITTRTGERDAQARLATERQTQVEALSKEKAALADKLAAAETAKQELSRRSETLHGQVDGLTKARDEQAKLAGERQAQVEALSKEKAALADKLAAAETAKQDLSRRSETLQGQVDGLTKARDEQAKLAGDRAAQLAQLTGQRDTLNKETESLKSDVQAKEAAIATMNERIAEQDQRERQLVEEIVRAEAQIDLIKDLLLREGGL